MHKKCVIFSENLQKSPNAGVSVPRQPPNHPLW